VDDFVWSLAGAVFESQQQREHPWFRILSVAVDSFGFYKLNAYFTVNEKIAWRY
jgi:hypothetical protein